MPNPSATSHLIWKAPHCMSTRSSCASANTLPACSSKHSRSPRRLPSSSLIFQGTPCSSSWNISTQTPWTFLIQIWHWRYHPLFFVPCSWFLLLKELCAVVDDLL